MKQRNKGRKIYKTKEKNYHGNSFGGKFMSSVLTVLLVGGLGFIGYSTVGPLLDFDRQKGDSSFQEEVPVFESSEITQQDSTGAGDSDTDEGDGVFPEPLGGEKYNATVLSASDLESYDTLRDAVKRIPEEWESDFVEVPLKSNGGYVYYSTNCEEERAAGAVVCELDPAKIAEIIRESGRHPSAKISVFRDTLLPRTYDSSGFMNTKTNLPWLDSKKNPWVTPFEDTALGCAEFMAGELSKAGFEKIVCTDLRFPEFENTDLAVLDERLKDPEKRSEVLISAVNALSETAESPESEVIPEVSAVQILEGSADVFKPEKLSPKSVMVNIDIDEIGDSVSDGVTVYQFSGTPADRTAKIMSLINFRLTDKNFIFRITGEGLTEQELSKARDEVSAYGYESLALG